MCILKLFISACINVVGVDIVVGFACADDGIAGTVEVVDFFFFFFSLFMDAVEMEVSSFAFRFFVLTFALGIDVVIDDDAAADDEEEEDEDEEEEDEDEENDDDDEEEDDGYGLLLLLLKLLVFTVNLILFEINFAIVR